MESGNDVFLDSHYTYRNWIAIVFVAVLGTADVIAIVELCRHFPTWKPSPDQWPGLIVAPIWLLGTGIPAGWLSWRMVFRPVAHTRIDATGITIDETKFAWEEIDSIYGKRHVGNRITMHFLKHGRWPLKLIRGLPIRPLTDSQYVEVANRLAEYLGEHFPHVDVG